MIKNHIKKLNTISFIIAVLTILYSYTYNHLHFQLTIPINYVKTH